MENKENYQYQDIVLREKPITAFKPNLQIMQNIKRIEAEIQQHRTMYDDQHRWIRSVINIRGDQRRTSRKLVNYRRTRRISPPRPKPAVVTQPLQQYHSCNVFCRILGASYCKQCSLELKVRTSQKRVETYINSNHGDESTEARSLTSREKAVLTLLPTTSSLDHQQQPGIKYFKRYNAQLKQYRHIPMLSSKETLRESLKKAAHVCENSETGERTEREPTTENKHTESKKESHGKQQVPREIEPPPNSLKTPPVTRASSVSRQRAIRRRSLTSAYLPRTDLEWYHEISQKRGERNANESKYPFDAIELATKLSALFRERYLPPERSLSRMSTVSSVDLDLHERAKEPLVNNINECATISKVTTERASTRQGSVSSLKAVFEDKQLVDFKDFNSKEIGKIGETDDEDDEDDDDDDDDEELLPIIPPRVNMVSVRTLQTPYLML